MTLAPLLCVIAVVPAAGIAYRLLGALTDRRTLLDTRRLVPLGDGRRLYLTQCGDDGPAIIFESGIASSSQNWLALQRSVGSFARTVAYDRGGLGWSSEGGPPRTPAHLARELRTLLDRAGVDPPYLLVGHSFGGLIVRRFAAEYPDDVSAVLILDGMRTEEWPPVNQDQQAVLERGIRLSRVAVPIAQLGLARLAVRSLLCRSGRFSRLCSRAAGQGGLHVLSRVGCELGKMPREVWPVIAAHWSSPAFYRGLHAHLSAVQRSVAEMHHAPPVHDVPVLLLDAASARPLSQDELARIGAGARQQIAPRSGHWVHLDQPDLVLETIRTLAEQVAPEPLEASAAVSC